MLTEKAMAVTKASGVAGKNICTITLAIFRFYRDGFRAMVLGRTLWKIIVIKLLVMFGILKLFFFPDFLGTSFTTDTERADHVLHEITMVHGSRDDVFNQGGR